jgi:hypothetical protein
MIYSPIKPLITSVAIAKGLSVVQSQQSKHGTDLSVSHSLYMASLDYARPITGPPPRTGNVPGSEDIRLAA